MLYRSTRASSSLHSFSQVTLEGLSADGGLFIPDSLPNLTARLSSWQGLDYAELATNILSEFASDIPLNSLSDCCHKAYGAEYGSQVAPLVAWTCDRYVLELIHGPTLAFKDVALQLLGKLFQHVLEEEGRELNIVAATSGDTGSAAIAGVSSCKRARIFVTHPQGRISDLQRLQMTTVLKPNVFNLAVKGSFDDCQRMIKEVAADLSFKQLHSIGAVNSINWARIAAQIVYYFAAYLQTPAALKGVPAVFSVPTGNFGNILAAEYARQMGLPISKLILASNANDILPSFFTSGIYRKGKARQTFSPAMDIQIASNFERYLALISKGDLNWVKAKMSAFSSTGTIEVSKSTLSTWLSHAPLTALSCSDQNIISTISKVYRDSGRLLDPHSATAWWALEQQAPELDPEHPKIIVATAHPAKFSSVIKKHIPSIESHLLSHPKLELLKGKQEQLFELPPSADALKDFIFQRVKAK